MTQLQAIPLLLGSLGFQELLLIFLIVLVIFGATKLPALGRGLGEGIRNFKRGIKSDEPPTLEERRADDKAG
jgi:sec-independent protein translocase protein TatA